MTSRKSCVKKKNVHFCITRSRSLLKTIDRFLKATYRARVILDISKRFSYVLGMCYILCTSRKIEKKLCLEKRVTYLGGFSAHGFFADGFLFPIKELGLLTNPGHWVRFWMALAPICIFHCKQCITMNEYKICRFYRFGFPQEKTLCNVCIFHCIFSVLY
jgi:hypothetical protein